MQKRTLETEIYKNKLTQEQIASKYGVSVQRVGYFCRKYQIRPLKYYERFPLKSFSPEQESFITGTILGDGSLIKPSPTKNAYLVVKHSMDQLDYVKWKFDILKDYVRKSGICFGSQNRFGKELKFCFLQIKPVQLVGKQSGSVIPPVAVLVQGQKVHRSIRIGIFCVRVDLPHGLGCCG